MSFLTLEKADKHISNEPTRVEQIDTSNVYTDDDNVGMNGNIVKSEASLIETCLKTIIEIGVILIVIIALLFIGSNISNFRFTLFTKLDAYTLEDYNAAVRRSFALLSGALIVICFIVKFVINNTVRGRFRKKYLRKINVYIYDVFVVVVNAFLYILIGIFFFYLVDVINIIIENGVYLENVNKETINIFRYVIVIVITIFGVLNSFNGISIIHKKNKFALEDYFVE